MPAVLGLAKRALHATVVISRFLNGHQWLTSALIIGGAIATLVLWTLLLPLPEAHGAYSIQKSLRFNDNDSAYLNRTFGAGGNQKTWTWSGWVKRADLTANQYLFGTPDNNAASGNYSAIRFDTHALSVFDYATGYRLLLRTSALFRDPSAWTHVMVVLDTTQAVAADRAKIYVNGQQVTAFSSATYPSQNADLIINNNGTVHRIGAYNNVGTGNASFFDGYMSDVYLIDGQALTPSDFAETDATTGSWKAKAYSGTYGTNGFHLDFADSSNLGNDVAGSNDWTSNNLDATDQVRDTPSNNFTILNRIAPLVSTVALAEGNLRFTATNAALAGATYSFAVLEGKWYWEVQVVSGVAFGSVGIVEYPPSTFGANPANGYQYLSGGSKRAGTTDTGYGSAWTGSPLIIGVALDMDAGKVWFSLNGSWQTSGDPSLGTNEAFAGLAGEFTSWVQDGSSGGTPVYVLNYGQGGRTGLTYYPAAGGSFAYEPPAGFKALSTGNLPAPAIPKPSNFFDAKTYTGNGSTQSITGLNFQPALSWLKDRTSANSHGLFDAVRGATQWLASNSTAAEATDSDTLTAFNSNGFSLGADAKFNTNGNSYVSWNWKESATSGFDIVTYTGTGANTTIPHGLGAVPKMIIIKGRDNAANWIMYHAAIGNSNAIYPNLTNALGSSGSLYWNSTDPTSSVFSLGTNSNSNTSGVNYVGYLFAEVPSYSKFGSYTGNGSADGPFVYTGFKPRWLVIKRSDSGTENWQGHDTARNPDNVIDDVIYMDTSNVEQVNNSVFNIDILSNGFKLRTTHAGKNASGGTYIYAAFAESPFKYATAGANLNLANLIAWEF